MMAGKKKILIIDDDSRNIFALSAVLRSKGFDCIAVEEVRVGLERLKEEQDISIVLMDMMMPEMDGYDAIRAILEDERTKEVPVIAVTAQAMNGDAEKCLAAGAKAYVSKPIDVDILLNVLARFMA